MQLRHAKIIVNEPKYLEALKVIAEAEAAEVEAKEPVEELVVADEVVEDQEPDLQECVD